MANVYYKHIDKNTNISSYQQLTFRDIGAAAQNHKHSVSELGIMNFRNNGCTGQNILENFDTFHKDLLFYVPQQYSKKVYAKRLPADILDAYDTVPVCNFNKNYSIENITGTTVAINPTWTIGQEYYDIDKVVVEESINLKTSYFYYFYPLIINYQTLNQNNQITINFKINNNENNYSINFKPITNIDGDPVNIEDIYCYKVIETSYPDNNMVNIGLVCNSKNTIDGLCFIYQQDINVQLNISDINITTNATINISQNYIDYYDVSAEGIPDIETSGSLGPMEPSVRVNYNRQNVADMIRYYRSYKFNNLLTWGQCHIIRSCIISGYCNSTTYNKGYFMLYLPLEFDEGITTSHITLYGYAKDVYPNGVKPSDNTDMHKCDIWGGGAYAGGANNKPLNKAATNNSNYINYQIIALSHGRIGIDMYFPTVPTNYISFMYPLKFVANNGLTIQIANQSS